MQNQTKRETADALLAESFKHRDRIPIAELVAAADAEGISRSTLARAVRAARIRTIRNGSQAGFWQKADS